MTEVHACWLHDNGALLPPELSAVLSEAERSELGRFRHPARARSFLLSRALLRHLLNQVIGNHEPPVVLSREPSGRLVLQCSNGWHISVSHCPGHVAVMAAPAPCGIDIEIPRAIDWQRIARRYFSDAENNHLLAQTNEDAARDFLALWTLKEAGVKALGTGLAGNLSRLAFDPGTADDPVCPSRADLRLRLQRTSEHTLAMAVITNEKASWHICQLAPEELLPVSGKTQGPIATSPPAHPSPRPVR